MKEVAELEDTLTERKRQANSIDALINAIAADVQSLADESKVYKSMRMQAEFNFKGKAHSPLLFS